MIGPHQKRLNEAKKRKYKFGIGPSRKKQTDVCSVFGDFKRKKLGGRKQKKHVDFGVTNLTDSLKGE